MAINSELTNISVNIYISIKSELTNYRPISLLIGFSRFFNY